MQDRPQTGEILKKKNFVYLDISVTTLYTVNSRYLDFSYLDFSYLEE